MDSSDYNQSPGTYGYEWGGVNITTGVTNTEVGMGLNNTNQLISKNLRPETSGWWVVWDKVQDFRQSHSDKWFVPSKDELNLVYEQKANLSNISTLKGCDFYWSSSEAASNIARYQVFNSGSQSFYAKHLNFLRVRLCVQFTQADID